MSQVTRSELHEFTVFLNEKVRSGNADMSPEQALDLWREQHPCEEDDRELLEAVARFEAGVPAKPHEQFDREFRARHGLPPK